MFGAVKLTKHPDIDQYKYSVYGIGFDSKRIFSHGKKIGKNVVIFGVDMRSSVHIDNKKKDTLILGKCPTQELERTLTVEKLCSINFTKNGKYIIKFKAKDSEIIACPLCLGNISKEISTGNMKKTGNTKNKDRK